MIKYTCMSELVRITIAVPIKKEVQRIINEVIKENPNETDWVKLGVKAKRRLMEE